MSEESWIERNFWLSLVPFGFMLALAFGINAYFSLSANPQERGRTLRAECAEFCDGASFMLHRSGECICVFTAENVP